MGTESNQSPSRTERGDSSLRPCPGWPLVMSFSYGLVKGPGTHWLPTYLHSLVEHRCTLLSLRRNHAAERMWLAEASLPSGKLRDAWGVESGRNPQAELGCGPGKSSSAVPPTYPLTSAWGCSRCRLFLFTAEKQTGWGQGA